MILSYAVFFVFIKRGNKTWSISFTSKKIQNSCSETIIRVWFRFNRERFFKFFKKLKKTCSITFAEFKIFLKTARVARRSQASLWLAGQPRQIDTCFIWVQHNSWWRFKRGMLSNEKNSCDWDVMATKIKNETSSIENKNWKHEKNKNQYRNPNFIQLLSKIKFQISKFEFRKSKSRIKHDNKK